MAAGSSHAAACTGQTTATFISSRPKGHPWLADLFSKFRETAHYSAFLWSGHQDLLYHQAELEELERQLFDLQQRDSQSIGVGNKAQYARNWHDLKNSKEDGDDSQLKTAMQIRAKISEFYDALIRLHKVSKFSRPNMDDLRVLQHTLHDPEKNGYSLIGVDKTIWGSTEEPLGYKTDIVAFEKRPTGDLLFRCLNTMVHWFYQHIQHHLKKGCSEGWVSYDEKTVDKCTSILRAIIAPLLAFAPIAILYYLNSMRDRLVVVAVSSVIFSLCDLSLGGERRGGRFPTVAAYMAVLVVFIASSNSNYKAQ